MHAITDSVYVSTVQIYRWIIIWLEKLFTPYWIRFLPTVRHLQLFIWLNFCPLVKCCFMSGNVNLDLYSICVNFGCIVGVQNTGVKICWENRRYSSAATALQPRSVHFEETQFMHLDKKSLKNPKTGTGSTYVSLFPFGSRSWLNNIPGMKKDCMLTFTEVSVDTYTSLPSVWCDFGSFLLMHFAIIDPSISYTDDLAFTFRIMFSLKDFVLLLSQGTHF